MGAKIYALTNVKNTALQLDISGVVKIQALRNQILHRMYVCAPL